MVSKVEGPCGQRSRAFGRGVCQEEVSPAGWHDRISVKVNDSWEISKQNKVESFLGLHSGCFPPPKKKGNTLHINILQKKMFCFYIKFHFRLGSFTDRCLPAPHDHPVEPGTQEISCTDSPCWPLPACDSGALPPPVCPQRFPKCTPSPGRGVPNC